MIKFIDEIVIGENIKNWVSFRNALIARLSLTDLLISLSRNKINLVGFAKLLE